MLPLRSPPHSTNSPPAKPPNAGMPGLAEPFYPLASPSPSATQQAPSNSREITSLATFSSATRARLQALYSDFSAKKTSNPTAYNSNIEWWLKALEEITSTGFLTEDPESGYDPSMSDRSSLGAVGLETKRGRLVLHANTTMRARLRIATIGRPSALGTILVRGFAGSNKLHQH
jgi:charged multivesicular body protein 7